jgi:hypothetical protein
MRTLLTATALAAALIFSSSLLQAEQNCTEKLEQNCISCHYNTRVCEKIGKKNKRSWKNTVKRMIRYGLEIDQAEVDKITECLVALEKNPGKFCDR